MEHAVLLGELLGDGRRRPRLSLVGIAADGLARLHLGHPREGGDGPWFVAEVYPMVELGVSKADEDTILIRHGLSHAQGGMCDVPVSARRLGWGAAGDGLGGLGRRRRG